MPDWTKTYEKHRPEVLAFLERRLWRRRELAADLCQETFARAMSASTEIRDPSRIRSYLLRTANNLVINHVRRGNRVVAESDLGPGAEIEGREDQGMQSPHAAAESSEIWNRIQNLMMELPRDQRIAFQSGVIERIPYEEIAATQNWTTSKVKISVFRARKFLMKGLKEFR